MTKKCTFEFDVEKASDIPRVGTRKTVRLNGRAEMMWIRDVKVRARKDVGALYFAGTATLGKDLWW